MLYKDWLEEWLELYVKGVTKERTYQKYRQQAVTHILPALGAYDLDALTPICLQRFSASLAGGRLSANTVMGILSVLRISLKKAVALGIADRQYTDSIVRPKRREKKVACFSQAEQRKIERYVLGSGRPRLFGLILSLYTGLRLGELLALTWADIDFRCGLLSVTKSCHDAWGGGGYHKAIDTPKTPDSERVIPIPRRLLGALREIRRQSRSPFVVEGKTDQGMQVRTYQRIFERILKQLGIPHRGFHALRHTFATRALEVGMDVKTLSEILGHRNPMITLQRYAHSLIEHKTMMMNKLGKLLP